MLKVFITAIISYLATSVDEIPVLFMLYVDAKKGKKGRVVTLSYFIGTFLLVAVSLLAAVGLVQIPVKWVIGLIGLIPVIMGIRLFFEGDDDEEKAMSAAGKCSSLLFKVLVITLALGMDDLGVYIPLFTTLRGFDILWMLLVYLIGTALLCLISFRLTRIDKLVDFIEAKERFLVGFVFIAIGSFVLYECGTIESLLKLINTR